MGFATSFVGVITEKFINFAKTSSLPVVDAPQALELLLSLHLNKVQRLFIDESPEFLAEKNTKSTTSVVS